MSMYMSEHFEAHGVELREALGNLQPGRMGGSCFHNGSWFNKSGVKIGWGDLGWNQVLGFPKLLPKGEMLFLVGETKSHWDLPKDRDPDFPGIDWILCNTRIFVSELLYRHTGYGVVKVVHTRERNLRNQNGLSVANFDFPDVEFRTNNLQLGYVNRHTGQGDYTEVVIPHVNRRKFAQLVMSNWSCDFETIWSHEESRWKSPSAPLTDPSLWGVDGLHSK